MTPPTHEAVLLHRLRRAAGEADERAKDALEVALELMPEVSAIVALADRASIARQQARQLGETGPIRQALVIQVGLRVVTWPFIPAHEHRAPDWVGCCDTPLMVLARAARRKMIVTMRNASAPRTVAEAARETRERLIEVAREVGIFGRPRPGEALYWGDGPVHIALRRVIDTLTRMEDRHVGPCV